MDKLTSAAHKLDVFFKILRGFLTAAVIVCLVLAGIVLVGDIFHLAPDQVGTGYYSVDIGGFSLDIAPSNAPEPWSSLRQAAAMLVMGAVGVFIARRAVGCIRAMLKPMQEGQPFQQDVSMNLRKLAWFSIILGVWFQLMQLVNQYTMMNLWDIENLLLSDKVTRVTMNVPVDLNFLLVAAVLFLLAYVFRYGTELQTLSDETL